MSAPTAPAPTPMRRSDRTVASRGLAVALLVGLTVGVVTVPAQGLLPSSVSSLANSAGPWSVVAFVVARRAASVVRGALFASLTLAMCEIGYVVATEIRGVSNAMSTVVFWLAAAALAGPALGVAAILSTGPAPFRRGAGFGVICGVLIGEGRWAWVRVSDTTDWRYWMAEMLIGVAIIVGVLVRHRSVAVGVSCAGTAVAVAAVVYCAASIA